jgi:hypothetical protein
MQIRIRSTGQVMYEEEFRRYQAETTGASWELTTLEVLDELGVDPVFEGPQATGGTVYQSSQYDGVEEIDGKWYTKYILGPVFTDPKEEAEYKARKDEEQTKSIRDQRNQFLSECDWTQLADAPVDKSAWATYRQQLRDITQSEQFPWSVTWPTKP